MTENPRTTKAEMLAGIEASWTELHARLGRLTEQQMTTIRDAQGWTVKDHVAHMAAWERSAVFFLQGKPRHAGLQVNQALFASGSFDVINAAIYRQNKESSLAEAMAQFREVHEQLIQLLQPLSDTDLYKDYRQFLPDEEGDDRSAYAGIHSNTTGHYQEHLGWIETLVGRTS